jgi:hypothetical protein
MEIIKNYILNVSKHIALVAINHPKNGYPVNPLYKRITPPAHTNNKALNNA